MIDGLKPYLEYTSTDLPWAPSVPATWQLVPNRALLQKRKELVGERHKDFQLLSLTKSGVVVRDISTGKGKFSSDMGTCQEVRPGDLVFCLFDVPETPRTVGRSSHLGMITGAYTVFECPNLVAGRFLELFYVAMDERKLLEPLYTGLRKTIPASRFLSVKTPLPPPEEQATIVRFLDHADRRIRGYIRAKQKLIRLLEEQKQAIIHNAVTRGLQSGVARPVRELTRSPHHIPWLFSIPSHWEIVRAKTLFTPRKERAKPDDEQLSATQAYGVIPQAEFERLEGRRVVKINLHLDKRSHVQRDDFVISMRSFQGGLERAWATGCIRSSYVVLRASSSVDVDFFAYLFKSRGYIQALQATGNFIRDGQDLNFSNFCQVDLPLLPREEQRAIAAHLDAATASVRSAIDAARCEVTLLRELRTRLIADVVTGQLDVRAAAAALPDEPVEDAPLEDADDASDDPDAETEADEALETADA